MDLSRTEELERQVKRLQRVTVMLVIGFLLLLLWRLLPGPGTVEARQFIMRDDRGVIRGALMMLEDGRPTLRLNDKNGRARTMLYLYPDQGGALRFTDLNGYHRLQMILTEDGWPELRFEGPDGSTRTRLGLTRTNRAAISVQGDSAQVLWNSPLP